MIGRVPNWLRADLLIIVVALAMISGGPGLLLSLEWLCGHG